MDQICREYQKSTQKEGIHHNVDPFRKGDINVIDVMNILEWWIHWVFAYILRDIHDIKNIDGKEQNI